MNAQFFRGFLGLVLLVCGVGNAKSITVVKGQVIDRLSREGVAEATIKFKNRAPFVPGTVSEADGNYFEHVNLPETYNLTKNVQNNVLQYTTTADGYYPDQFQIDLGGRPLTLVQNIILEPAQWATPLLEATGGCKVNDNLFRSGYLIEPGLFGCVELKVHPVRWGVALVGARDFEAAQAACPAEEGLRLPTIAELRTLSNGNGYVSHLNFDARLIYWSGTVANAKQATVWVANLLNTLATTNHFSKENHVVCVFM